MATWEDPTLALLVIAQAVRQQAFGRPEHDDPVPLPAFHLVDGGEKHHVAT